MCIRDRYVDKAAAKDYDKLKADHVKDYQNIFERVDLDLGQIPSDKATDALLSCLLYTSRCV